MPAVGDLVANLTLNSRGFSAGLGNARTSLSLFGRTATGTLSNLAAGLTAYFGAQSLLRTAAFGVQLAADAETAEAAFTTLTGSATKARTLLNDLRAYSKVSFFTFPSAAEAAKQMMAYGIQVQDVLPTMKMLGDIALGDQQKFDHLALALGQVASYGKLRAQERNQFTNAGFNPLQELSKMQGRSITDLAQDMEDGKISTQMVIDALKNATQEGGRFFNSTKTHADTLAGRFANLKEEIHDSLRMLGTEIATQLDLKKWLTWSAEVVRIVPGVFSNIGISLKLGALEWAVFIAEGLERIHPMLATLGTEQVAHWMGIWAAIGGGFTTFFESVKGGLIEIGNLSMAVGKAMLEGWKGIGDTVLFYASGGTMGSLKDANPLKGPMAAWEAFKTELAGQQGPQVEGGDIFTRYAEGAAAAKKKLEEGGGLTNTLRAEKEKAQAELAAALEAGKPGKQKGLGGFVGASFNETARDEEKKQKADKATSEAVFRGSQAAIRIMQSKSTQDPVVKEQKISNKWLEKMHTLLQQNPAPAGTVQTWFKVGEV